jgi:arginyl-tRNA synthetase
VFRQAAEAFPGADFSPQRLEKANLGLLIDEAEMDVIHRIAQFPRMIEAAAEAHEPHRVAFYLYDLASSFHSLWNKGKDLPQLRFVNQTDKESTEARLALVHALKGVLGAGLAILGVTAPDEMR